MFSYYCAKHVSTCAASFLMFFALPAAAWSGPAYEVGSIRGSYVLALNGSFTSPPPPFTGTPLQFQAAQVGRLTFDGAGQAWGEATLTFHHPAVPFAVRTRISLRANYTVDSDGHLVISVEESPFDANGEPAPVTTNTVTYECYIVQRRRLARCLLHTLISFQQGPDPRNLPVTMAGSLRRQY